MHGLVEKSLKLLLRLCLRVLPFLVVWTFTLVPLPLLFLVAKKMFGIIIMLFIAAAILGFLGCFLKQILTDAIKAEHTRYQRMAGSPTYLSALFHGVLAISKTIRSKGVYALIALIAAETGPAVVLAAIIPVGPVIYPVFTDSPGGLTIFNSSIPQEEPTVSGDDAGNFAEAAETETTPPPETAPAPKPPSSDLNINIEKEAAAVIPSLSPDNDGSMILSDIELDDPDKIYSLPELVIKQLLFSDDTCYIPENATAKEAAIILENYIDNLTQKQLGDHFSMNATREVQAKVAKASNTIVKSSSDLESTLSIQEDAWNSGYDNFTLSKLIGNSYYGLGLAYYYHGTIPKTAECYLLTSIQWRFKSLEYQETSYDHIRKVLARISQAYQDIATIDGLESGIRERAKLLSDAFEIVKNTY